MESICDLKLETVTESPWIRLVQVQFTQRGVEKRRDITHSHNSCGILIHNITRNVFVFVRQFRPGVFMYEVGMESLPVNGDSPVNIKNDKLQKGFTIELCAGILDKESKTVEDIAVLEVLEECGYKISVSDLEKISSTRNDSYHSGTLQNMFYVQVTDNMKMDGYGGGNEEEGEFIQIVEVKVEDVLKSMFDDQLPKPVGWTFAIIWFCYTKASQSTSFTLFPSLKYHLGIAHTFQKQNVTSKDAKEMPDNSSSNNNLVKKRSPSPSEFNANKKLKNGDDCYDSVIKDVKITNIKKSEELQLYRLHYEQNRRKKTWDFFHIKSTCATLVHNISRNVFVLVKKFSPAVHGSIYLNDLKSNGHGKKKLGLSSACLTQLSSTFYSPPEQPCIVASDNIFRTLGYRVCSNEFHKILHCRSNVGTAGALLTLLYVKVTDEMLVKHNTDQTCKPSPSKSTPQSCSDILDVVEVPVLKSKQTNGNTRHLDGLTMALSNEYPLSLSLALMWFYLQHHSKPSNTA